MSKEKIKKTTKRTKKSVSKNDDKVTKKAQVSTDIQEKKDDIININKENIKSNILSKNDDFDWQSLDQSDSYSEKERSELENEYNQTLPEVIDKKVIDGTVVMITDREVVVDINFKSDGIISFNEFKYNTDLKIGDIVEVLI